MRGFAVDLIGTALFMIGSLASPVAAHGAALSSQSAPTAVVDETLLDFDISPQSLDAALDQYAQITGRPALFPSDLIRGRVSSAVQGYYPAEVALQMLLQGTGLMAARRSSKLGQTFVLKEIETNATTSPDGLDVLFDEEGYAGWVQARIWQGLCADARTRPGDYSALLRFRLGADGRLDDPHLLGSSGDAKRDAAMLDTLRSVRIERAPPRGIATQVLTLAILPDVSASGPRCATTTGRAGDG